MKRLITLLAAIVFTGQAWAEDFVVDNLKYTIIDAKKHEVSVGKTETELDGNLVIPFEVENDGVKYSVTNIDDYAFMGCRGLTSVTIPNSVIRIGDNAFSYCSGLTEINVEGGNTAYSSDNGVLFDKRKETLICCPAAKQGIYDIPTTVRTIGDMAFYGCGKLTAVAIGNSVTSIGHEVFVGCSSLTSITIPKSVTSMGSTVFADCNPSIYCEVENIPEGWEEGWNNGFEVIWGYKSTPITESAANAINIYAHDRTIVVENATDEISVYDAMGRLVCRDAARHVSTTGTTTITVNTTGVYIVKVGNTANRVVIN